MKEILPNIFAVPCPATLAAVDLYGNAKGISEIRAIEFKLSFSKLPKQTRWNYFLPVGNWEIICRTNISTEEQAQKILFHERHPMYDYVIGYSDYGIDAENVFLDSWKDSLQSLLRSRGLDSNKNYLLLKNIS